jgi:peptidoglycan/xylan/chitin deacetylase (PgdA/CDA1 family)
LFLFLLISVYVFAREVAITFDDLPRGGDAEGSIKADREMTSKLLAPFQRDHIPVTGFVNECNHSEEVRSLLGLWIAAGAELGNHTCSHPDLNKTAIADFESDIISGEAITTELLGHRPRYFRYPFLHAGNKPEVKGAVQEFLTARGYRNAPVTLDNSDYMFAAYYAKMLASHNVSESERIRKTYIDYLESIFGFFERRSIEVTGHEIRQILLLHANQLNADALPDLLTMMRRRRYTIVSLPRALADAAYSLPESYVGTSGFSWIHRWSMAKGMTPKGEPDEPEWIRKGAGY